MHGISPRKAAGMRCRIFVRASTLSQALGTFRMTLYLIPIHGIFFALTLEVASDAKPNYSKQSVLKSGGCYTRR
jgi:hypothetical protein